MRRHMRGPENAADRKRALELLEQLRGANWQLRECYIYEIEQRMKLEARLAKKNPES